LLEEDLVPRIGVALLPLVIAIPSTNARADERTIDSVDPDDAGDTVDTVEHADGYDRYGPYHGLSDDYCEREGGVVGRRRCPPYGEWGAALEGPYVIVSLGVNMRHLPRAPLTKPTGAARTTGSGSVVDLDPGSDTSYTVAEQIAVSTSSFSYLAFEVEMSPTTAESAGPGSRAFAAGSNGVFGLHFGSQLLQLGGELAAGARIIDTYNTNDGDGEFVLEARARGSLWLTPWFTIGAALGASLLDNREWFVGIHLGAHSWAYGGM
jgi:hypothetical protein